ncbi:uroporphyrinogen-III C-methyltransferase [Reinekea sp.]|jgi:uroporphyrin-3 C-methyltransferase|uniref:uroporphyrinogen-III C-methyltransferase n=1 Tax=Reinekea sp. TaxID=1970455 RepID=UPI003989C128
MSDQAQNEQLEDTDITVPETDTTKSVENKAQQKDKVQDKPVKEAKKPSAGISVFWRRFLIVLMVIIVISAGIAYGGWWLWQNNLAQVNQLQQQNQQLAEQVAIAQQQITEVSNRRVDYADDLTQQVSQIESLVVESAQRMNREADRTENRWPLEEALTLTRLAQRRLFLDKNAAVSISLLKSADDIIATLDAAAVLPLRQQIASDILALNNARSVDLNGIYFQLGAIADEVRQLTWVPKPTETVQIEPEISPVEGFWQSVKKVVVISRLDSIVQAPPIQSDFELWRQHTLMVLAQSQLALLAQNQLLFEAALSQSLDQLKAMNSQFDFKVPSQQLQQLKTLQLNPTWPDIGKSVLVIDTYINKQNEIESEATQESGS